MTKKKKAPAAQQLINSLLNESKTSVTQNPTEAPSFMSPDEVKAILPEGELSLENSVNNVVELSSEEAQSGDVPTFQIEETGDQPSLVTDDEHSTPFTGNFVSEQSTPSFRPPTDGPVFSLDETDERTASLVLQNSKPGTDGGEDFPRKVSSSAKPPFDGTKPRVDEARTRLQVANQATAGAESTHGQPEVRSLHSEVKASSAEEETLSPVDESTVRVQAQESSPKPLRTSAPKQNLYQAPDDGSSETEVHGAYPRSEAVFHSVNPALAPSAESALKQSENLRIAQARINELEQEMERLRRENEKLASAGETMRRRADELISRAETAEAQARESKSILEEEKKVLRGQLKSRDRENQEMRTRLEELELRLESNFKKIRVRERELEHRLEIIKMESATLVASKDKMILELKRQIDQLTHETDIGKQKTQELFNQYKDKQETIRRVVRALRIALTILEGDEENVVPIKKAE